MARKSRQSRLITPADLQAFVVPGDVQVAPDGHRLLFTHASTNERNQRVSQLWIVDSDGRAEPRAFTSGEKDRLGRWSPTGNRIAFVARREDDQDDVYLIPDDGGEAVRLTRFPEGSISAIDWSPDGTMLAVAFRPIEPEWSRESKQKREDSGGSTPPRVIDDMYYRLDGDGYFNAQRHALFVVSVATGEYRKLFDRDTTGRFDWDWAPDSTELVVSANTAREPMLKTWKVDLFRVSVKSGKARRIEGPPEGPKSTVRWSPDGRWIAYAGRSGREIWGVANTQLHVCDVETGATTNLLADSDYCLTAATLSDSAEASFAAVLHWSADSRRLLTTIGWRGTSHVASIEVASGAIEFHTGGRKLVSLSSFERTTATAGLLVTSPTSLPEVHVGRFEDGSATGSLSLSKRSRFHDQALGDVELARPESHWVTAEDGHRVQLWVLRPPRMKSGARCPAVLEIHGGPHCQYGEAFFHEFQVLAAAGYAVVYSNPRGSKGYGEAHCMAIKGRWGDADWKDIQAVTRFMQQQDWIDSERLGVMGGSYGGYMTNWVISHTNEFRAAITDRCVSNLISMIGSSDLPLVPDGYWPGNGWDDTEELWQQSPLKHFRNVKTPTLVIHSEGDLRCNVEQGEQVFTALKLLGVPTRFVRYPSSTSHGMSRMGPADLRIHRLNQILNWWKSYLES